MASKQPDDATTQKLRALAEELVASFAERMAAIETAFAGLDGDIWSKQAIAGLYAATHLLAGTSGSFGYGEISQAARAIVDALEPLGDDDYRVEDDMRRALDASMATLRQAISDPKAEEGWF